jgi:endonuclease/exonuclease/phosphatase family metal-dependent hydrolase
MSEASAAGPGSFKVLTYNIQRGLSALKKRQILEHIVMALEISQADIVCLQEVWQAYGVTAHQLEELCRAGWHHRLWRPIAVFPTGSQGNAVLSRFRVERWHHVDISVARHEPRALLHVEIRRGDGVPITILCIHFGLRLAERRYQSQLLKDYIAREVPPGAPVIMAGDFNDWRGRGGAVIAGAPAFKEAIRETTGRYGRTFPSFLPFLPLDRIYFRNLRLQNARVIRRLEPETHLSDHLPVEAVFSL